MRPITKKEMYLVIFLLFFIAFGIFFTVQKYKDVSMVCESGLYGKQVQTIDNDEKQFWKIIKSAYSIKDSFNYECKWFLFKDKCYCRNKDETEWKQVIIEKEKVYSTELDNAYLYQKNFTS